MEQYREKFQALLRELFQFDCADLNFGIYRIMNHKRDVLDRFVSNDLPKAVTEELDRGTLAEQSHAAAELKELAEQITETLGKSALDADGNLADAYTETPLGKKYLDLKVKAAGSRGRDALEANIFNHLYAFFNRYYQDGDFISKRRYSKRQKYAIPYNGEEVYLYWANNDQYYVKSADHFRDYTFTSHGVTVHFKLHAADVEHNNVKAGNRFFVALPKKIDWNEKASILVIPFEYRPLSEKEGISYGKKNQQDAIISQALEEIPKHLKKADKALLALTAERHKATDERSVSYFEHHLRQYTRANTSDFFIHKDLKGFLSRELDFYLKNEVFNLAEVHAAGEGRAEAWFQIMRVIKSIGDHIIEFLAQLEDFQKMLWEKRKFVTETQYCITLGTIDAAFYSEIATCDEQWTEWKEIFQIDEDSANLFTAGKNKATRRIEFLKSHPTLVLDTKHFSSSFVDRLLQAFPDLDGMTDALLISAENFHALNLISERYRTKLKCVHIDPPYNTQTSGFLYKNDYQHSSWLAMMENRVTLGLSLLTPLGSFLCHIDENEYEVLYLLCNRLGIPDSGTIVWDKKNPMLGRKGIATQHEYVLWRSHLESSVYLQPKNIQTILDKAAALIKEHGGVNKTVRKEFAKWINSCDDFTGGEKAYKFIDDDGRVFQSVAMGAPEPRTDPKFHIPLIHPVTKKPCPVPDYGWSRAPETLKGLVEKNEIIFGDAETVQPRRKVFLTDESQRQLSSVISNASRGKNDIEKLGLEFPYCHPVSLYEQLLGAAVPDGGDIVLDYFAGSGTTGHAVINLNRDDGGQRRFILVEVEDYFDSVLLPRIKKVTFSPDWKDGKPQRLATKIEAERSPRIIKYIRLEDYEDALNNIQFDDASGQAALKFDDYLLKYMLRWEARSSATFLNVSQLVDPFHYTLNIHRNSQTNAIQADIPETFSYLLGLHITRRSVFYDDKRRYLVYRGRIDHREIAVIWRTTQGWTKSDLERDQKFVAENKLTEGADEILVNGDSFIPNAKALDPIFKSRMFSLLEA
jgi:adenine-specific DNA-methyltransferase